MELATIATLAGILVLLVLSAFFSGSETAVTAASKPRMHQLEKQGLRRARVVNRLFANRERMIGAILFGNNLVNILASALATSLLISMFGDAGVVYATAAMTLLVRGIALSSTTARLPTLLPVTTPVTRSITPSM